VSICCPELEAGKSVEAAVASGSCEVGLAELPVATKGLVAVELGQQPFHLVLAPGTAAPSRFPLAKLNQLDLVATPPGTSSRARLDEALEHANGEPPQPIKVETGHRDALIALVLAGAGAAFLPEPMAEQAAQLGATVVATTPVIRRRFGVIHRAAPLSPAARAVLVVAKLPGATPVSERRAT
jgi:DNA-binding transcriptional LysR family regulator